MHSTTWKLAVRTSQCRHGRLYPCRPWNACNAVLGRSCLVLCSLWGTLIRVSVGAERVDPITTPGRLSSRRWKIGRTGYHWPGDLLYYGTTQIAERGCYWHLSCFQTPKDPATWDSSTFPSPRHAPFRRPPPCSRPCTDRVLHCTSRYTAGPDNHSPDEQSSCHAYWAPLGQTTIPSSPVPPRSRAWSALQRDDATREPLSTLVSAVLNAVHFSLSRTPCISGSALAHRPCMSALGDTRWCWLCACSRASCA
ncbi:hypothetical protein GGR56DRAFT_41960 [Xylariaceae sp. FL0804]|nr:hypothetical protein GGR56DRAFT_41960 [Xylariaceae sp. FL0804]